MYLLKINDGYQSKKTHIQLSLLNIQKKKFFSRAKMTQTARSQNSDQQGCLSNRSLDSFDKLIP